MKKIEVNYKEPGGIIWKVLTDASGNYLVIESRNGEVRKTMLSVVDLESEKILYTNDQLPKPWWVALKAVDTDSIILQGYKESNSPDPGGLYVFDLINGNLRWKDETIIFHSYLSAQSILVSEVESNEELVVDLENGKTLGDAEGISNNYTAENFLEFPLLYNEDNIHYKSMAEFIERDYSFTTVGPIEYLEYKSNVFISFYIRENNKMTNILIVLDEEGECILTDRLMEGSGGIGMSAFFICKNKLIYVKNKTSIALVNL